LGDRNDIHPIENPFSLIPRGTVLEQVEEEDSRNQWLTHVHLEKWP